jgi:hypothetical protein
MKKHNPEYILDKVTDPEKMKYLDEKQEEICKFLAGLDISIGDLIIILDQFSMYYKVQWMDKKEYMRTVTMMYDYYKEMLERLDENGRPSDSSKDAKGQTSQMR